MRFTFIAMAASILTAVACSSTPPAPPGAVTFHKDVEPILQKSCQMCHQPGGIAPFSLTTYSDAKPYAADMVLQTQNRVMPPWGAQSTSECSPRFPWKNDMRLSDQEIATIKAWHDGGDWEGNQSDAPPPITAQPVTSLTGTQQLQPDSSFRLTQTTTDTFRCFVLDPKLITPTYLTAMNIIPGNKTIVHHVLVFSVPFGVQIPPPTDGIAGQYDCFGGVGVSSATLVSAWAPGILPFEYPAGAAQPIAGGTKFVMQVHYHPHATATTDPDLTTFEYKLDSTTPQWIVAPLLLGNFTKAVDASGTGLLPGPDDPSSGPAFLIPPDSPAHVESMQFTVPTTYNNKPLPTGVRLMAVLGHMHLVGQDIKIDLTRAAPTGTDPPNECLLQEPAWNFDWQRAYQYDTSLDTLPTINPNDVIKIRCTYNNTMQNVALASALTEAGKTQTQQVSLGETTMDEMCLGGFSFVYPYQ
jgi:hypothetical protein